MNDMNNTNIHRTTIEPIVNDPRWGIGARKLVCSVCGHYHSYQGEPVMDIGKAHDDFMNRSAQS